MIRLAILERIVHELIRLFAESAPIEQGACCLLREGRGVMGFRLLASSLLVSRARGLERLWLDGSSGDSLARELAEPAADCRCPAKIALRDSSPPAFWQA